MLRVQKAPCTEEKPHGVAGMCLGPTDAFSPGERELTTGGRVFATSQPVSQAFPPS